MALFKKIVKYKKIIMLVAVVLGLAICVIGSYHAVYKANVVEAHDVIPNNLEGYKEASKDEFLANFSKFEIKLTGIIDPYTHNDNTVVGSKTFTVYTEKATGSKINGEMKVTIGLGANWIKYIGENSGQIDVKVGKDTPLVLNYDFNDQFPKKGSLWFIEVEQPTLYVLVEWSDDITKKPYKYTYLEYDYSQYSVQPVQQ